MKKRNMIILLILILTIGFASVSTTLVLNGTMGIGLKNDDFEVIFVEALLDGTESSKATIGSDKKTITFSTDKLTNVGDTTELVYKVKNNSTQYGANVTMTCNTVGNEYLNITSTFDGKSLPLTTSILMEAQEVRMGRITAELIKGYAEENGSLNIECTIVASATEEDKITNYIPYKYTEEILNGADPVIKDNLIPVVIENNGIVKKADTSKQWYSYQNKKWANAVILEDESVTYNVNEVIPEDNIESYFVWIPKYSYQLWDLGEYDGLSDAVDESKVHTIPVKFGLTNTSDEVEGECTTPMNAEKTQGLSGESGNCKIGDYMTHPAFISMNTNGLWVGKFETGYKGATSIVKNEEANGNHPEKVQIKPDCFVYGNISVANSFYTSYDYQRNLDSHMMKNTEWGAVAYLSNSIYGINSAMRINNVAYKTGYASITEPSCYRINSGDNLLCNQWYDYSLLEESIYPLDKISNKYNALTGNLASATGNVTGIYDMAGGTHEAVVASYMETLESIGLSNNQYAKYIDLYNIEKNNDNYNKRILGDATGELGPFKAEPMEYIGRISSWYGDASSFYKNGIRIIGRGNSAVEGLGAGIFTFYMQGVDAYPWVTFRIVLAP